MQITTIGLDLAKNIFHVHGVTSDGGTAFNRPLRRGQVHSFFGKLEPCLIGMEACGTSHYWARELMKLGHDVRLMPPIYVKPFVKRGKTDAVDAEAICEAVTRPTMRFVPVKSPEQQALLSLHRARDLTVRQRTQTINMLRGLLLEFGHSVVKGIERVLELARAVLAGNGPLLPDVARQVTVSLCKQLLDMSDRVRRYDKQIVQASQSDARIKLLKTIPGIGPVTASAIVATVGTPRQFGSGRDFAAWLGLTPLNRSSGGKERLGRISKMGDRYLRKLLVGGMTSRVRAAMRHPGRIDPWLASLLERKPVRLATVAMANKTARVVWAVLVRNEPYKPAAA